MLDGGWWIGRFRISKNPLSAVRWARLSTMRGTTSYLFITVTLNFVGGHCRGSLAHSLVLYYYAGAGNAGAAVKKKRRSTPSDRGRHQRPHRWQYRRRLKIRR